MKTQKQSFGEIYQRFFPELFVFLHGYTSSRHEIEDILQDTFLKLLSIKDFDKIQNLRGFLYFSARNAMLNRLRDNRNRERLLREMYTGTGEELTPEEEMSEEEVRLLMRYTDEAVETLPEQCREIFRMAKRDGKSYTDIAIEKQLSIKTVETQMGRALQKIRSFIKEKLGKL